MNNESIINRGPIKKKWKKIFIGVLTLQAVLELGIGLTFLFNFPYVLQNGFSITYSNELDILGLALGLYLLLLTTLMIISAIWTYNDNYQGIILGMVVGTFLLTFGVTAFFNSGDTQPLLIDGLRGLITMALGFMAIKELK